MDVDDRQSGLVAVAVAVYFFLGVFRSIAVMTFYGLESLNGDSSSLFSVENGSSYCLSDPTEKQEKTHQPKIDFRTKNRRFDV